LKRGDVVIAAPGGPFGSKPRPYVVVQSDVYATPLVVLIGFTTAEDPEPSIIRPRFRPSDSNGLRNVSDAMVDALIAVRRPKVKETVGALSEDEMYEVEAALIRLFALAESA
jgi:mRNA interferase MazF